MVSDFPQTTLGLACESQLALEGSRFDRMAESKYRPGDEVPKSGIYLVSHYQHRSEHDALLTAAGAFPRCRVCGNQVTYRLVRGASPIELDQDFTGTGRHER